jgi:hypothetical protein
MKAKLFIFMLIAMMLFVIPVSSQTNSWDVNTLSLHHFDTTSTIQSYNQTHGVYPFSNYVYRSYSNFNKNTSLDQVGLNWYPSNNIIIGNGKFGNGSMASFSDITTDLLNQYPAGYGGYKDTPYNSDWDFKSAGQWTVEGWLYIPTLSNGSNGTLVSWLGNGTSTGGPSGTDGMKYNGTQIYLDKYNFLSVGVTPLDKLVNSTKPIPYNTYTKFSVSKNATGITIHNNGRFNGTVLTGTNNFSAGYSDGSNYRFVTLSPPGRVVGELLDEIRISNVSRYTTANYTPETVEFNNPNNATTLIASVLPALSTKFNGVSTLPLDSNTYTFGDEVPYSLAINNISDTKGVFLTLKNMYLGEDTSNVVPTINSSMINKAWFFENNTNNLEVPSSVSYIQLLPGLDRFQTQTPIDDVDDSLPRTYFYLNTTANTSTYVPITLFNVNIPAGTVPYYFSTPTKYFTQFPNDLSNQALPNTQNPNPAYPTTFEYTNGGLTTLRNNVNSTSDVNVISYTGEYGESLIELLSDAGNPGVDVNVGQTFNMTSMVKNLFYVDGFGYSVVYNKTLYKNNGFHRNLNQSDIVAKTSLATINYPSTGSINTTVSRIENYNYNSSDLITVGSEQKNTEFDVMTYQFTPLVPNPDCDIIQIQNNEPDSSSVSYNYYLSSTHSAFTYDAFDHIYPFDICVSDKPLQTNIRLININTGSPITGAATVSYDARESIPAPPQNVVGGLLSFSHKGGIFNVTVAAEGYFATTQTFTVGTTGTTIDVLLTPLSGPSQNVWWTPHIVQVTVMDNVGTRLPGVQFEGYYNESSMPLDWVQTLYGVKAGPAGDMVNSALALGGTTGSDGTLTTTMLGSLKYDFYLTSTEYNLNHYHVQAYPSDSMLNIYVPTTLSESVIPSSLNYTGLNATKAYIVPTNSSYWSMCIDFQDITGSTNSVTNTWKFANNGSILLQNTFAPSKALVTQCKEVPHIKGVEYWWWANATRTVT